MNKRKIAAFAAVALGCVSLTGCAEHRDGTEYKIYMPDGAPALAMSALMDSGFEKTTFTVVPASAIAARVSTGEADLAIMPINAAATLYNKGVDIVMLSVNTHGNLYVVGDAADAENLTLDDLKGKRVGVIGQGNVPDLTFRMLLDKQEVEYTVSNTAVDGKIALRYADDGPSLMPLIKTGQLDYGLLGEPAATTAVTNLQKSIVMDIQKQWDDAFGGDYPQACLVAKKHVAESGDYVQKLLAALESSDGWAEDNPEKAVEAVKNNMEEGTVSTLGSLSSEVIRRCNIKTVTAIDSKQSCAQYFGKLAQMQTALGAPVLSKVPDDAFYYGGN